MDFECEFCHKMFSTKYKLKHHQQTAKYCLDLQGKHNDYICKSCEKHFSSQKYLGKHQDKCETIQNIISRLETENKELKDTIKQKAVMNKDLRSKNNESDKQIAVQAQQIHDLTELTKIQAVNIQELQDKLKDVAVQGVKKHSVMTTNNILKLEPMTQQWLVDQVQHLKLEHIKQGAVGYADFASQYSFKNRVVCTDTSRKNLKYVENGSVVKDIRGKKLAQLFFTSIKSKNDEFMAVARNEILQELRASNDNERCSEINNQMLDIIRNEGGVNRLSQGQDHELRSEFVNHLCMMLPNP